jgi:hypothetical protein
MWEFPKQHLFILQNERDREMDMKMSCVNKHQEAKGTPASGAQSGDKHVCIDDNLWYRHVDMIDSPTLRSNLHSQLLKPNVGAQRPARATRAPVR